MLFNTFISYLANTVNWFSLLKLRQWSRKKLESFKTFLLSLLVRKFKGGERGKNVFKDPQSLKL